MVMRTGVIRKSAAALRGAQGLADFEARGGAFRWEDVRARLEDYPAAD